MRNFDIFKMSLGNLRKRKLRTFLTVLGVIIGTASIVVMVSIGIGVNESFKSQIERMGSLQVITVYAPYYYDGGGGNSSEPVEIDDKAIEKFKEISGVTAVTPAQYIYLQLVSGKYLSGVSVMGIDPATMEEMGYKVGEGRALETGDKSQIVLGSYVSSEFYNPKLDWRARYNNPAEVDVFNDKMQLTYDYSYGTKYADKSIKPVKVEVVGVMDMESRNSYNSYMPIEQVMELKKQQEKWQEGQGSSKGGKKSKVTYEQAFVKVSDMKKVTDVQETIKNMGYEASSLVDYLNEMQKTSNMLQMVLGAIGAVSLFVAAIGIANTMIMSIYERTKEIGVMKVIGAALSDIKKLFLAEAAFIGLFGGIIGIILSFTVSYGINMAASGFLFGGGEKISVIPVWLVLASAAFSTFVGIAAGYFPAKRAMKLDVLSAIRTE